MTRFSRQSGCTRLRLDTFVSRRSLTAIAVRRLPLSPPVSLKFEHYKTKYIFVNGVAGFIRVMKWAKEYRQSHLENKFKRVFRNMKVYYIYGSAGCGKTSYVFQKHGYDDVYRTTNYEFGWIDDYNGEKILFLDEFRSSFKISEILDYLDGQPIRIRGRHYNRVACYDIVYIVSNLSLKEQYTNIQQSEPKTWAAFCRRITTVYDFDKSKDIPVNKYTGELKSRLRS